MSFQTSLIEVSKKKKIVVFGGNGYVGQGVVEEALREGVDVISINRSGPPINFKPPVEATGQVTWLKGDVFEPSNWKEEIKGAAGVISCIGAFGSNRFMEKINGDANIVAIKEAKDADIPRFVFVSTVENNLPEFFLRGYFNGKRRAEKELLENYGTNGAVLRPGFIYGTRNLQIPEGVFSNILGKTLGFPLWAIGKPLEQVFSTNPVKMARDKVPGMKACLAAPISRDAVAKTAVSIALGSVSLSKNVLAIEDINSIAGNSKQQ